jgi:hypothetical protein
MAWSYVRARIFGPLIAFSQLRPRDDGDQHKRARAIAVVFDLVEPLGAGQHALPIVGMQASNLSVKRK